MGTAAWLEWPASLDVTSLLAAGWQPLPLREFIIKAHSRCDLACDYCYMYEMADQVPAPPTAGDVRRNRGIGRATHRRACQHAHHLKDVTLILHGGEPLLAGPDLLPLLLITATRTAAGSGDHRRRHGPR